MAVARYFGLEYLWIDSLCIVQDDDMDWQRESIRMKDVYGCSTLNISASGAQDGSVGCFFDRDAPAMRKISRSRVPLLHKGRQLSIDIAPSQIYRSFASSPLLGRAWCFQERFISPRTLHFNDTQLFWECQENYACETFPDGSPQPHRRDLLRCGLATTKASSVTDPHSSGLIHSIVEDSEGLDTPLASESPSISGGIDTTRSLSELWSECVRIYSRTKLTRQTDKLIALAGVASWAHQRSSDQYLAGLWRENLETQLLWHAVTTGRDRKVQDNYHLARPVEYLAPLGRGHQPIDGSII